MSVEILRHRADVSQSESDHSGVRTPAKIVVVYEDFDSGLRLVDFTKRLRFRYDEEFAINTNLWQFEMLEIPAIRCEAAREAACADLILLATGNHRPLRAELKSWLEQWIAERHDVMGTIAVTFAGPGHGVAVDPQVENSLREAAAACGVRFLVIDSADAESQLEENFALLMQRANPAR